MLNVKCPHCQAGMKLRQAPPSGKVKCPRCSQVVPVRPTVPAGGGSPVDPDDAGFDFGRVNFPSASPVASVSHFPLQGQMSAYEGPIPGDPLEAVAAEEAEAAAAADQAGGQPMPPAATTKKKKKKMSPGVVIGILGGVGVLVVVAIIAAIQLGGSGGGEETIDVVAAAQATAPTGYQAVGIEGCVVLMPAGYDASSPIKTSEESVSVVSDASSTYFYMSAMDGGKRELTLEQMTNKAKRQLGGDVLGAQETTRNGYKGVKGMLATSAVLPNMPVEFYHVDERFVIIGCTYTGAIIAGSNVDHKVAKAESDIFFKSFRIGPKPGGWW